VRSVPGADGALQEGGADGEPVGRAERSAGRDPVASCDGGHGKRPVRGY
jgi:hypothetical protein